MGEITVVGVGADGWTGLTDDLRALVTHADVVLGGRRHLAMLPASTSQVRATWPSPLREELPGFLRTYAGRTVVALASGDPLVSGIGTTLVDLLGADRVRIVPALSSVALARARLRWSAESVDVVSLVGRDPRTVSARLTPGRRLVVLSSDARTPTLVASWLTECGYGASRLTVLADLGTGYETRIEGVADGWDAYDVPPLNVVCVECAPETPGAGYPPTGLPDDAYENDGQLTKRDIRASALARLAPRAGELLWDVGAGAGSVGIEWMRADPRNRAIAIEADAVRAERVARNAARLGVPGLHVVRGHAPEALRDLPAPDAVFVGGGATRDGVLGTCVDALGPGGRIVAHGVTLQTEALLARWYEREGGELTRIAVETADALGSFSGWRPARAVVSWSAVR